MGADSAGTDLDADAERQARESGDHERVAKMLAARCRVADNADQRRLIRLRLAAVLEQQLGRLDEACHELELILDEYGEDPTALRYLADLRDRRGESAIAAKLWLRASRCSSDDEEKTRDVARCCESLLKADEPRTAQKLLDRARALPVSPRLIKLRINVCRALDDHEGVKLALADFNALSEPPPSSARAQESDLAPAASDPAAAESTVEQSTSDPAPSQTSPSAPAISTSSLPPGQTPSSDRPRSSDRRRHRPLPVEDPRAAEELLECCKMDYLLRGAGTPQEANETIRKLRSIRAELTREQKDLRVFLLVEALDVVQGGGAAMTELQNHWEEEGRTALVAVAVAERLVRRNELKAALRLYDKVVDDDLQGLRSRGRIALDSADAAHSMGNDETAHRYVERAAQEQDTRAAAQQRRADWFGMSSSASHPPSLQDLGWGSDGPPAVKTEEVGGSVRSLKNLAWGSTPPPPAAGMAPHSRTWSSIPPPVRLGGPAPVISKAPKLPTGVEKPVPLSRQAAKPLPLSRPASASPPHSSLRDLLSGDGPVAETVSAPVRSAPPVPSIPPASRALPSLPIATGPEEEDLLNELIDGSFDAGEYLMTLYKKAEVRRPHDELAIRRYQALLRRGDRSVLRNLRDAALGDDNAPFGRAIEHVLAAFDPDRRPPLAPRLDELSPQPEATTRMLFAHLSGTVCEALGIAPRSGILRREMSAYDITGADRVPAGATTPIGQVYGTLSRLLDTGGARVFHKRRSGPLQFEVALLNPLAAIITGSAERITPTLRYTVGACLVAASPELAYLFGDHPVEDLLIALRAGFGPVDGRPRTTVEQNRIAEDMWHVVHSATDRRLREICADHEGMSVESARALARRTCRRAGMFAAGDLVTAIVQVIDELDLPVKRPLRGATQLRDLCGHPEIADLYELAIQPEYAQARWSR